ncbi:MAG: glutamyl-tRNA reductase [Actinobacteria bacterium]|nr:glutamyl-tRNA reductase [Actinomycetota bacterium]
MSVVVIGLNHRTMPLGLFERLTIDDARLPKALDDLTGRAHVSEAVILSTCNRTEIYAVVEAFHGAYQDIRGFLAETSFLAPEEFADHLYVHYDREAIRHLFTVVAGLDSAVLGDTEVLGQTRTAWERAKHEGATGPVLNLLFRHALRAGKRARTDTGIARGTASVSYAAVEMAAERIGSLEGATVLVLGAGDMGEGMAVALASAGVAEVLVANRTWERAVALAERVDGRAVRLGDLPVALADVDVMLTSTGAAAIMLEHADLEPVVAARCGRPLLVVDIAVPRDVDPSVTDLPGVTLLDMEDLRRFAQAGMDERRREVHAVERIVVDEVDRFLEASSARAAAPLVGALHARAESMRQGELERFRSRLSSLSPHDRATVDALTRAMMAKVLHEPSVKLKDLAGTPKGDRLAEALRTLYDLEDL